MAAQAVSYTPVLTGANDARCSLNMQSLLNNLEVAGQRMCLG